MLLEPRGRELERVHLFREHELDRLAVLERPEYLNPRSVDARAVLQPQRSVDGATLVPPVACDDLRRQRLAQTPKHPVHDVEIVEEAAQEALAEGADDVLVTRADRVLDLLGLPAAGLVDDLARDVVAAHDLAGLEERLELRIIDDDADVAKVLGRAGERVEHRLDRRVVALHRSDLDDLPRAITLSDDRVGVGERDAHRLLHEDMKA